MQTNQVTGPLETEHPLDVAARLLGGRSKLAAKIGVSVAAIGNWKLRGVPIEVCVKVERATDRRVKRQILRPEDWQDIWPELASSPVDSAGAAINAVAEQGAAHV